jgi:hypothetical protein
MALNRFKIAFMLSIAASGCSTTQIVEEKVPLPIVPEYVRVPHPAGFDLADLRAILVSPLAPPDISGVFADTCDVEFKKLTSVTIQKEEREKGALELVTADPERMHWCFYSKISKLQEVLQSDSTWTERQKKVLEAFEFLSPIANAFLTTYHDSRYLRWAAQYYSKVSEWVFFKKLAPTPESSLMFTTGARPELEPWVNIQREESRPNSVFTKYGISFQPSVAGAMNPFETQTRVPASSAAEPAPIILSPAETLPPEQP